MKYLFKFLILTLLFPGCRRCGECFGFWEGERILFLDEAGNNLLDPSNSEKLEIESFKAADGRDIVLNPMTLRVYGIYQQFLA